MPTFDSDVVLVYAEGTSNKFWRCQRRGAMVYLTYGRIGTKSPQRNTKPFPSVYQAQLYAVGQEREKRNKGYQPTVDPSRYPDCSLLLPPDAPAAPAATTPAYEVESAGRTVLVDD